MDYILDTNIILHYIRETKTSIVIERDYNVFDKSNRQVISIVTVGEIKSIDKRNYWGVKKLQALEKLFNLLVIIDINAEDIIEKYAEIDAFS